ncbi:MAG: hypothetical protein SV775_16910 [Thermodesulfobacteriota bacterium]|nr:hypothetical protein [Thermodesulfobacteriota bacterium]
MPPQTRLGGLKILKEVVQVSLIEYKGDKGLPGELFRLLAKDEINVQLLTCENHDQTWGMNIVIDSRDVLKASNFLERRFGEIDYFTSRSAVLSLFPHRSNPEIAGALLEVFGKSGIEPKVLAHSNSAISAVLAEDMVSKAAGALFGALRFGAYRTPGDWKLAQKDGEGLYREVVASYQEKRPRVYFLEWQDGQVLLQLNLEGNDLCRVGVAFNDFARLGLALNFLISSPSAVEGRRIMLFGLPETHECDYLGLLKERIPGVVSEMTSPVAIFSMNGPHFADRYGIVSELLATFDRTQVELLALSCAVSSITGVIHAHQIHSATKAIQGCFEVPSVIRKACTGPHSDLSPHF